MACQNPLGFSFTIMPPYILPGTSARVIRRYGLPIVEPYLRIGCGSVPVSGSERDGLVAVAASLLLAPDEIVYHILANAPAECLVNRPGPLPPLNLSAC